MAIITLSGERAELQLETNEIDRFRHITPSEKEFHPSGVTRVDYLATLYVKEADSQTIAAINASGEGGVFGRLTMPDKEPVWFRGPGNAAGPVPIPPSLHKDGILSGLKIAGKLQFVREQPQQVYDILKAIGGSAVPPLDLQIFSSLEQRRFNEMLSVNGVWDSDVPELQVKVNDDGSSG